MSGDNKLTFNPPTHLPELTLNLIRSSRGHSTPSLKISCKSVQLFSRNLADKETNKVINKLWCESTTNPTPLLRRRKNSLHYQSLDGSTGLPEEPIAGNVDKC